MDENNTVDLFISYINKKVLPFIDYEKLQESYSSDMSYAKGVLNELHLAMCKTYGGRILTEDNGDEGFVVIPSVVRGMETGNIAVALLDLDLSSSGEHCGTAILCKHGVISQSADASDPGRQFMRSTIGSYDYCYTAAIPDDIHVNNAELPKELKDVLKDYHKHKLQLSPSSKKFEINSDKPSLIKSIRDAEKDTKEKSNQKSKKVKKPEL